jgi:hypothetical protein
MPRTSVLALSLLAASSFACGGATEGPAATASEDAGAETAPPVPQTLQIDHVDLYQAVQIPLFAGGAPVEARKAPIIAGREALVRVAVKPDLGWRRKPIVGTLTLSDGAGERAYTARIEIGLVGSSDAVYGSTLNFVLPADALGKDTTWSVEVSTPATPQNPAQPLGRVPEVDRAPIAAIDGGTLRVVLVPVKYDADGSGRLPPLREDTVETYRQTLHALYPTRKVEVSVREPFPWNERTAPSGDGWTDLLTAVVDLRNSDRAPPDVYYYGLFTPAEGLWNYCASGGGERGCVLGLSGLLVDPNDAFGRGSIGLGFGGERSARTMAHEIGHAHGRAHAPCGGAAGVDRRFPYADGSLGGYGWNIETKTLIDSSAFDMMGYCNPEWISDYNYNALHDRLSAVARAAGAVPPQSFGDGAAPLRHRFVHVERDGALRIGRSTLGAFRPSSAPRPVVFETESGSTREITGWWYPYGEIEGGYVVIPEPDASVRRIRIGGLPSTAQPFVDFTR